MKMGAARYWRAALSSILFLFYVSPLFAAPLGDVLDFTPVTYTVGNKTYLWVSIKNIGDQTGTFQVFAYTPDANWNMLGLDTSYTLTPGETKNLTNHFEATPNSSAGPGNLDIKINHTVGWDDTLIKYVSAFQNDAGSGKDAHSN